MNSYERAVAVLSGEIPDRVPIFEALVDPAVTRQMTEIDNYAEFCESTPLCIFH
ncbi:MAG: hypothetical protein HPY90_07805 [Syntrophothermus sp.]|uniref:hypothetical protein n=1 Tax=Syntrophothermus sp. TaxID=2736299 RepID=UPI00257DF0C5|nr:hypothetical protein [Syntrophothermus sp.]NSW83165.1 hypothetical protein [Syntrophothermus sp.]